MTLYTHLRKAPPSAARLALAASAVALAILISGCASNNRAPVEERNGTARTPGVPLAAAPIAAPDAAANVKPLPGAENAGKPGYYSVKPGDTLIRVGLENGQNWKDIVRWNN